MADAFASTAKFKNARSPLAGRFFWAGRFLFCAQIARQLTLSPVPPAA
jgi:hypothetical protein